jgi:hypothetical protein
MATPSLVKPPVPRAEVAVVIERDPSGNIVVHPDPFWVHKSEDEEVKWFCSMEHKHHDDPDNPCFTVDFKGNSPFADFAFKGHHAHSGCASVKPDPNKLYKYSITVGNQTLDPGGGVKP